TLGSAFDAAALALAVTNTFVVDTDAPPGLAVEGEGAAELPRDQSNLVLVAMARAAEEAGGRLPAAGLTCTNRIPLERGLGSSAAATVGGLLLADGLLDAMLDARRLLHLA